VWTAVRVWRRFRFPLLAVFGTLPVAVVLTARLFPPFRQWLWIWPVCYVLLDAVGVSVRGKWRLVYAAAELAAAGVLTWVSVVLSGSLWALLLPPVYVFLLMYGMAIPKECRDEVISRLVYQISVLLHILGQVLLSDRSARGWLLGAFFVFASAYQKPPLVRGGGFGIAETGGRDNGCCGYFIFLSDVSISGRSGKESRCCRSALLKYFGVTKAASGGSPGSYFSHARSSGRRLRNLPAVQWPQYTLKSLLSARV